MARAKSSLPVPLAPVRSTVVRVGATRRRTSTAWSSQGPRPMMPSWFAATSGRSAGSGRDTAVRRRGPYCCTPRDHAAKRVHVEGLRK
jgi:hypothetical protein